MKFVDTHAHIHAERYDLDSDDVLNEAQVAGVATVLCVGTDDIDSARAIEFAKQRTGCYASIGLHPHDAKKGQPAYDALKLLVTSPKVVAIGECGLDYYYLHSTAEDQEAAFRYQIELALEHDLAMIFHVRDAFADFFRIVDEYSGVRGVVHSFTSNTDNLDKSLERGFYVALNGIMTFTKDQTQLDAATMIPLEKLLLETDSPFLTPVPKRGTVNTPTNVVYVAEFLAELRGESVEEIARETTNNAQALFGFSDSLQ